ncbi:unnamed protein product [Paramecium octaurelia]|uniref:RING-type E3 ubiquitin transferase n=1 Tax=Paramecium octaurelia TaxID=43137 RepID=A0A8S1SZ40_PAROT|nr:unnamed protein product [Paramecium octaurelia]
MQSNLGSTFQCNFCLSYVPNMCKEVHNVKCGMKNIQDNSQRNQLNEEEQIPQQQDFPQQINFKEKVNQLQQFQQAMNNSQQFRNDIKSQQNQQNISNIISQGATNTVINITRQNVQLNATQEQQPAQTLQFQQSRIQQQGTSSRNFTNQQISRFLEIQRSIQPQNQQLTNLFRTNYEQQQQPVQQLQFPRQQVSFRQTPNSMFTPNPLLQNISQFQQTTPLTPLQNDSNNNSIFQTNNLTQRIQNMFPSQSDDSSNEEEEEISEEGGLNNFDLFKNYTDEEVNQMNKQQFYQYFIHKQITENHLNEPDVQIQKMMEQQNEKDNQCVICQEAIIMGEDETKVLICKHEFHQDCISNWITFKSTCPICKTSI